MDPLRIRSASDFALDFESRLYEASLERSKLPVSNQKNPLTKNDPALLPTESLDPNKKYKFVPEDFEVPYQSMEIVGKWYKKHPALSKRNSYVVQNHFARAKHFDLRMQLDNSTYSWAIPRGLSDFDLKSENHSGVRQAFETPPHPISHTLFEGGEPGVTAVWDIGTYTILETKSSISIREKRRKLSIEEDIYTESTTEEDDSDDEDVRQEKLFSTKFHYACGSSSMNAKGDRILQEALERGKSDVPITRGFVVELNGARYQKLKIVISHREADEVYQGPSDASKGTNISSTNRRWQIMLANPTDIKSRGFEAPFGDKSILTHRTMDQIKASRAEDDAFLADKITEREQFWKDYFADAEVCS